MKCTFVVLVAAKICFLSETSKTFGKDFFANVYVSYIPSVSTTYLILYYFCNVNGED